MSTPDDWIRVELTPAEVAGAKALAERCRSYGLKGRYGTTMRVRGYASLAQHFLGAQGEFAVSRYCGSPMPDADDWTWEADKARGYDVGGWQVRTCSKAHYGLNLHAGDQGKFILVFGHEAPVMWLAGWLDAAAGFDAGQLRHDGTGDTRWWRVAPSALRPLPEQRGFRKRGNRWLIDPEASFWCEACKGTHPIREHRICRGQAA